MKRRQLILSAIPMAALLLGIGNLGIGNLGIENLGIGSATAQTTWPSQPLRIIVPFAPGGSSDFIARLITNPLSTELGVPVIVENKPGGAGNLGTGLVALGGDPHMILLSDVGSIAIGPLVTADLPFKLSDIKGVTMLGFSPHLLVVYPGVAANSIKELAALSKTKRVNVASSGSGSPNHLGVVEIAGATGMQWQHIPYKGGAQALTDTMGGTTDAVLNGALATLPHVKSGKLKAIGVSSAKRMPGLDVPTIAEQGVPGYESGTYQGVTVAATMPAANVAKLNAALLKIMAMPEITKRMNDAGADVTTSTPEEISNFLIKESARWAGVIKKAGPELEGTK
jgi:tripartite-type tricarboxylate transporter receptor subunit TctC